MLLAIDIGNTNIAFGLFRGRRLIKKARLLSRRIAKEKIKRAFSAYNIEKVIICSVAPKVERQLIPILRRLFKTKPAVLGKDIKVPIKNLYKRPKQVGQDRLVNAYAGCMLYKPPLIIIDFGTAVTFDVISKSGAYLGGIITPGIELALDALAEKAALLPKIKLNKTAPLLGKTTSESIRSGIFNGYAAMCDGLAARLKKRFGLKFRVVATGGNARLVSRYSNSIENVDEDLTLKGINLIFQKNKKNT